MLERLFGQFLASNVYTDEHSMVKLIDFEKTLLLPYTYRIAVVKHFPLVTYPYT